MCLYGLISMVTPAMCWSTNLLWGMPIGRTYKLTECKQYCMWSNVANAMLCVTCSQGFILGGGGLHGVSFWEVGGWGALVPPWVLSCPPPLPHTIVQVKTWQYSNSYTTILLGFLFNNIITVVNMTNGVPERTSELIIYFWACYWTSLITVVLRATR